MLLGGLGEVWRICLGHFRGRFGGHIWEVCGRVIRLMEEMLQVEIAKKEYKGILTGFFVFSLFFSNRFLIGFPL